MNTCQFGLFIVYVIASGIAGMAIRAWVYSPEVTANRYLKAGESFLIGGCWIAGLMVFASLWGGYNAVVLWSIVVGQLLWCCSRIVRQQLQELIHVPHISFPNSIALGACVLLISFFVFRNCFFLVDVDSHSTYLYAQRLWLERGSSIFGSPAFDMRIFVPHLNAVPYALGLALFPTETLFPQLIVAWWTVVACILVFGYMTEIFKNYFYGLSAVMLVLFNDHMFFSGANNSCIINSAIIALLVAAVYHFVESRRDGQQWRLMIALMFAAQLLANKYQLFYTAVLLTVIGGMIQPNLKGAVKTIKQHPQLLGGLLISIVLMSLWYVKNWLATGVATFPILAGHFQVFNWTNEMSDIFNKVFAGPLQFNQIFKYLNYLFIWPGINAAKYVCLLISIMPLIMIANYAWRKNENDEHLLSLNFWLAASLLILIGVCLVSFVDPRHYRYGIAVMAMGTIIGLDFIWRKVCRLPQIMVTVLILIMASLGWPIMLAQGGDLKRPTFVDNWQVVTDKLHAQQVMKRYFPDNFILREQLAQNPASQEKFNVSAWDTGVGGLTHLSAFLMPPIAQIGLWHTTVIRWSSYARSEDIINDLSKAHIQWILRVHDNTLQFETLADYAARAVLYDRNPKELFYNYGFPAELAKVNE